MNPLSVSGQAAYEDVKKRHGEIKELENSIAMLEEIFADMQHLTESQVHITHVFHVTRLNFSVKWLTISRTTWKAAWNRSSKDLRM